MRPEDTELASGENEDFASRNEHHTSVILHENDGALWLSVHSFWLEGDEPDASMVVQLSQEQINGMARWLTRRASLPSAAHDTTGGKDV